MDQMLRVRARNTPQPGREAPPCVPDPHGADASPQVRRIIGRRHEQVSPGRWAWVSTGKVESLAYHHDIAKAIRDGDLYAADEETARVCCVEFDPTFGGEENEPADAGGKD